VVTEPLVLELELSLRSSKRGTVAGAASTYLIASATIPNMTGIILFQYWLQGEIWKKTALRKA
jgi:hypothetical protein